MNDVQAMLDGLSAQMQRERSTTQFTLGNLIAALEAMPLSAMIDGIKSPHSYRGYYCDLAFEPSESRTQVATALVMCREAMGQVFEGYKGGDYMMGATTPLWIALYGCCGKKIVGITADGAIETTEDDE